MHAMAADLPVTVSADNLRQTAYIAFMHLYPVTVILDYSS
jgi:hypothetical protein